MTDTRNHPPDMTRLSRLRAWRLLLASAGRRRRHGRERAGAPAPRRPQQQTEQQAPEQRQGEARESVLRLLPADSVTEHSVDIPAARSPTPRPPARSHCSTNRASARRRSSTPPMSPRMPRRRTVPSPSPSTADPAPHRLLCTSAWSGRRSPTFPATTRRRAAAGQSADLARLHRPGHDRSGRHRLEPAGQARRRRRVLRRAAGRPGAGQDHRALPRQDRPRQLAQIPAGRELWRVPRRQGGAGAAARAGHRDRQASSWCRR